MKYYIISGEPSGDLHASNLAKNLFLADQEAHIRAWGGHLLRQAGAEVIKDYKDLAYMGFVEVATHLGKIINNFSFCKKDILAYQPDVVILVDYPGFNLRMARFLHQHHIKVFYYISPQIWAWKKNRIKIIKKYVDEMFVILPFEVNFYASKQFPVHYFGHPLLDAIKNYQGDREFIQNNHLSEQPIIAILPGSRKQEIQRMLPTMLAVAKKYNEYQYVIAGVENHRELYKKYVHDEHIKIVYHQTYALLQHADAAMVTSGTATLETALFNVPQVVCYKANYFSYHIALHLVKDIQYISLVNLIADDQVVTELIQHDMNINRLSFELDKILNTEERDIMLRKYQHLHQDLGDGSASQKIADCMIDILKNKK